jgi:phenylacetic acid degradation operon negative regulatory protein
VTDRPWTPWRPGENASSARALLLTLLGEFVLPSGGQAWTSTFLEAMAALEVEPKTTRQAITRTAAAGLLRSARAGRQVSWSLTDSAVKLLTEGTERIYHFGRDLEAWDGRWLLLLVTVPEADRHLRYRLRTALGWQGFATISPGVWACPWVGRERAAHAVLEELGLDGAALSFAGASGAVGSLEERAYQVWDLAAVEAEYEAFLAATEAKSPGTDMERFVDLATLVHDWRHFPGADPGLPESLVPLRWRGQAAAELFHHRHAQWREGAWRWWREQAAEPTSVQART